MPSDQPLVTIVTPVLNGMPYLRAAIESVLSQDYPQIEYLVFDAGSNDGTHELLHRFGGRVNCRIQADRGTADALNQAFRQAKGQICGWLSADDVLLPGAVSAAVEALVRTPEAAVAFGGGRWIDESGSDLGRYPVPPICGLRDLSRECVLCQPACFFQHQALASVGYLNDCLLSAFDYDLWIRLAQRYPFVRGNGDWALSRMHRRNKSLGDKDRMFAESMALLQHYFGYLPVNWVYGELAYARQRTDQFFSPLAHSAALYWAALPAGWRRNPGRRLAYSREWVAVAGQGAARCLARLVGREASRIIRSAQNV